MTIRYSQKSDATAAEWISLEEAKNHVKALPDDTDNELIANLVCAAREYCEGITGRAITDRNITAYPDELMQGMCLPKPPVRSIKSITVYDSEGKPHTISDYTLDKDSGQLYFGRMPGMKMRSVDPIEIEYSAGYEQIPAMMKQAMLLMIGHWYINRESVVVGSNATVDVGLTTKDLLRQYKVWWF